MCYGVTNNPVLQYFCCYIMFLCSYNFFLNAIYMTKIQKNTNVDSKYLILIDNV
jgi:hypothetical protein